MATVIESIQAALNKLNLKYSDVELENRMVDFSLDSSEAYSLENSVLVKQVIIYSIVDILATPDISEDSYSVKYDRDAIIKYVAFLSASAGIENPFEDKSSDMIRNYSNIF